MYKVWGFDWNYSKYLLFKPVKLYGKTHLEVDFKDLTKIHKIDYLKATQIYKSFDKHGMYLYRK